MAGRSPTSGRQSRVIVVSNPVRKPASADYAQAGRGGLPSGQSHNHCQTARGAVYARQRSRPSSLCNCATEPGARLSAAARATIAAAPRATAFIESGMARRRCVGPARKHAARADGCTFSLTGAVILGRHPQASAAPLAPQPKDGGTSCQPLALLLTPAPHHAHCTEEVFFLQAAVTVQRKISAARAPLVRLASVGVLRAQAPASSSRCICPARAQLHLRRARCSRHLRWGAGVSGKHRRSVQHPGRGEHDLICTVRRTSWNLAPGAAQAAQSESAPSCCQDRTVLRVYAPANAPNMPARKSAPRARIVEDRGWRTTARKVAPAWTQIRISCCTQQNDGPSLVLAPCACSTARRGNYSRA